MALHTRDALLPFGQYVFMLLREVGMDREKWECARSNTFMARMCLRWGMEMDDLRSSYACIREARKNPPDRVAFLFEALSNFSDFCYCMCEHVIHLDKMRIRSSKPELVKFLDWFAEVFDTITSSAAIIAIFLRRRALNNKLPKLALGINMFSIPTWIFFITSAHLKRPIPSARVAALCSVIAGACRIALLRKRNGYL
eukprot:GEMP01055295.1.p1 GENE.GEMP01055295.1~~GEMP01055295.1.p1  ORF type:complete len:198 (+),score=37.13 GEMP01055295.1:212-805(+)